jgi:RHS repeat-associated protein
LEKSFKKTITKFMWDGNFLLHEWKEHAITGEKLSSIKVGENGVITWVPDINGFTPAAKVKDGKKYSIISDHLGTPYQMYKEDGSLFWECELDSYGDLKSEKGDLGSCPFRYQGQYHDVEIDLYYNRYRYYSPEDGRYISPDPILIRGGLNIYSYVSDVNLYCDKLGLAQEWEVAPYGTKAHEKDDLQAHELLQNAHLKHSGETNASNPAMALTPEVHKEVSRQQSEAGLHDPDVLKKQTPRQNINANAKILENVMSAELQKQGKTKKAADAQAKRAVGAMKRQALAYAKSKGLI